MSVEEPETEYSNPQQTPTYWDQREKEVRALVGLGEKVLKEDDERREARTRVGASP